jgi:ABC-2 type transport system ATP-binding protein
MENSTPTGSKNELAIEAKSLNVDINESAILKSLNFQVSKGQIYALLGGNGAGKSTTLKTFLGFNEPSSGQALVNAGYRLFGFSST